MEAPYSILPSVGSSGKEKKKKKKEVHDWFSYHGRMQYKLSKPLSVMLARSVFPHYMIYNIDGLNAPPMPMNLFQPDSDESCVILGSWNGLVAMYHHASGFAYLVNPYTSVWGRMLMTHHMLCSLLEKSSLVAFCYDPTEDEYKGLICDIGSRHGPEMVVMRFKNGSCNYKNQKGFPKLRSLSRNISVVVNGVPHWICDDFMEYTIVKFDPKTEPIRHSNRFYTSASLVMCKHLI